MLFSKEILRDGSIVGIWKMEETEEDLLSVFCEKQAEYSDEISRFQSSKRKLEFLSVRCLLKELTGNENGIFYKENTYPSLVDNSFNISISHTNGYASVIIHPQATVGIDIEQKKEKILHLKHKFLSEKELKNLSSEKELEHLLLHWSAKETMFKMMGETNVDFIEHLHILPFFPMLEGMFHAFETKSKKRQDFLLNYKILDDFVLVWSVVN